MILTRMGDIVKGERLLCVFRKMRGPYLIIGSSSHRAQRLILEGLPAEAVIEKEIRLVKP